MPITFKSYPNGNEPFKSVAGDIQWVNEANRDAFISLPDIEPGLEGTEIGKVRLLMRKLGLGNLSPAQFYSALDAVELRIDHNDKN